MPLSVEQLAVEAMRLPAHARVELVEKIVGSLEFGGDDAVQKKWIEEAIRRRDEVRSREVQAVAGEEVLAEARRAVGR